MSTQVRNTTKVRKTLTLDSDVVEVFSADDPDNLSGAVNAVLAAERDRRLRRASLAELDDELTRLYGEPDPEDVAAFTSLLA